MVISSVPPGVSHQFGRSFDPSKNEDLFSTSRANESAQLTLLARCSLLRRMRDWTIVEVMVSELHRYESFAFKDL